MKRRELKDEECMDRDLWRREIMSLGWGKLFIHGKNPTIKIISSLFVTRSPELRPCEQVVRSEFEAVLNPLESKLV
jgi:hypothetical protein